MILLVFIIVKLLVCCLATDCENGLVAFEGSCYLFGQNNVGFADAKLYCRQHRAHLVHIESIEENTFLKGYINAHLKDNNNYWLGVTDAIVETVWRWTDDNGSLEYKDWGPYEPKNVIGVEEDCAVMHSWLQYQWADVQCISLNIALCEQSGETTPAMVG